MNVYPFMGRTPKRFRKTTIPDTAAGVREDLIGRDFTPNPFALDERWCGDIERHEALPNRAVMEGHRLRPVAAGRVKLRTA